MTIGAKTTTDETTTENLNAEPENSDNSIANKPEHVADEAVNGEGQAQKGSDESGQDNNDDVEIPEKFKNKDGSVNLKELIKSYKNAEPLFNEKAQWQKEKVELEQKSQYAERIKQQQDEMAKTFGFNNYQEFETNQKRIQFDTQMANLEADEYAKFLNQSENPAETRELLLLYKQQPSPELLEEIESRFGVDVHKKVGASIELKKNEMHQQNELQKYESEKEQATNYLVEVTDKYGDYFKNEAFTSLYGLAFQALGTDLDTPKFVSAMDYFKESVIKEYETAKQSKAENDKDLEELSALNPSGEKITNGSLEKNILEMSPEEMKKEFKKYK